MPAIKLENFNYAYTHPHKVLDNINLTIEKGSFTVLLGPSGAGKTTLCLTMAGAVPHYFGGSLSGTAYVNGIATKDCAMQDLSKIVGTVLQDYETQLVTMTVEEEVAFNLENMGMTDAEIAPCLKEALDIVGLTGREKAEVASLSGGQKQRLVLASVLAARPDILVLDEPSSALDPEGTESLYALLGELNKQRGLTILVVEHDIAQVLPYADQFILMEGGTVLQAGTCAEVFSFMWNHNVSVEAIPPLWQIKLALEADTGCRFANWRSDDDAVAELRALLQKGALLGA